MEENFVPYELALELKELGFREKCFGKFSKGWLGDSNLQLYIGEYYKFNDKDCPSNCLAPIWEQVWDWFEEKHKLFSGQDNVVLSFGVTDCRNNDIRILRPFTNEDTFKTKEEVQIARLEFLIKQIEK